MLNIFLMFGSLLGGFRLGFFDGVGGEMFWYLIFVNKDNKDYSDKW